MEDPLRGTGRTTRQLQTAPEGAVYVWCNGCLDYPRMLANTPWVNRPDLRIIGPEEIRTKVKGLRTPIVVDHAARLTGGQAPWLETFQKRT